MKTILFSFLILLLATSSNLYAQNEPDDCMIIYYPFNGNGSDQSGLGNDATMHGATSAADITGAPNTAFEISGNSGPSGSDVFIEVPNVVDSLDNLTISLWVKHNGYSHSQHGETYVSFGTLPQMGTTSTAIYYSKDYNEIYFTIMTENGKYTCTTPFLSSWVGTYQHFALVYDGSNGILKGYHNGTLVASKNNIYGKVDAIGNYGALGKHWWANGAGHSTRLNCTFDDLKVYRCALTPAEIMDNYTTYVNTELEEASEAIQTRIYPNPLTSSCTFEFNKPSNQNLDLLIYNCLGQIIQEYTNVSENQIVFERGNHESGIYFYCIKNESVTLETGKLIFR